MKRWRYSSRGMSRPYSPSRARYAVQWSRSVSARTPSRSNRTPRVTASERPAAEVGGDLPPAPVAAVVVPDPVRIGLDAPCAHHRRDRVRERGVDTGADGRKDGGAEARALGHAADVERDAERVGDQRGERRAPRHAATRGEHVDRDAGDRAELLAVAAHGE